MGRKQAVQQKPAERVFVPCSHVDCPDCAIVRLHTPTGWANVCLKHYDAHWLDYAKRWNANPDKVNAEDARMHGESARARWYRENKLPYEPPKLTECKPFRLIAKVRDESVAA